MDVDALARAIRAGDRRALSRGITLVESDRPDHRDAAAALLQAVRPVSEALRIAMTGAPGVGKSTFIEALGCDLVAEGRRVAVLAVDPSSERTGGSILGDKTRMERLSRSPGAFVRPSPSRSVPGGVARRTREAVTLCEAAGFDPVVIETVGVGQSETMVAEMTDVVVLLIAPGGGDELQGVKRGIIERADVVLVTKADGDTRDLARRTASDYAGALRLVRPQDGDTPIALAVSAEDAAARARAWAEIAGFAARSRAGGRWQARRQAQARRWFQDEVRQGLLDRLRAWPSLEDAVARLEAEVSTGAADPFAAAAEVLAAADAVLARARR